MKIFAEIEQSFYIPVQAVSYFSPVWKYVLWNDYKKNLPFMASEDSVYPSALFKVGGLMIDYEPYLLVSSIALVNSTPLSYCIIDNTMYVHYEKHRPAWVFYSIKSGAMFGYTNNTPQIYENVQYLPDLLDVPPIEYSSDLFTYARMKFNSGNVRINNTSGVMDKVLDVFGNNLNIFYEKPNGSMELLLQYYIAKYNITSTSANFTVKDKRERLSVMCPNEFFARDTGRYKYLPDDLIDKPKQNAYGKCKGVNAVCINEKQVYKGETPDTGYLDRHYFYVVDSITKITRIQIEMKDKDGNPAWVEVFPGFGIKSDLTATANKDEDAVTGLDKNFIYQTTNPKPAHIMKKDGSTVEITTSNASNLPANDGIISLWSYQAMEDNPQMLNRRGGKAKKVKVDGVFNSITKPGDIVKAIIKKYTRLPNEDSGFFNNDAWYLCFLHSVEIGIVLDTKKSIYEYIEQIQNGAILGWQLLIERDRYTARLDNPNRDETFNISVDDIMNIRDVEVEIDGENYATQTSIKYDKDYTDGTYTELIDISKVNDILDIYHIDKPFENESLLTNINDALVKSKTVLDDFTQARPVVRGIMLRGDKWLNLQLFEIGIIDFKIELPGQLKALQPYMADRRFLDTDRYKIIAKKVDLQTGNVVIDVRQTDITWELPFEYAESLDVTGEYPGSRTWKALFDNLSPTARDNVFEMRLEGGKV